MRSTLLIAAKDLQQRLRDASAIVMAIVLPIGLAFILNLTIGSTADEGMAFRYAVVDEDHGALARTFVVDVLDAIEQEGLIETVDAPSSGGARRMVDAAKVQAAIVVPAGFSTDVQGGGTPALRVIGDVDQGLAVDIARSLAEGYAQSLNGTRLAVATIAHTSARELDPATIERLIERASAMAPSVELADISASRRELDANTYFAAGMAVFFVFFTVQFGVSSILDERKEGTMARLLAAPIGRGAILSGKLLASFLLGILSMTVLIVTTALLMDAHWGDPIGVGLLVVAGVLSALAIMAFVATLAKTAEQAGNWQAVIALILGMLGGSFFPLSQAGGALATLSLVTPHAWFLRGLGDLAGGGGPTTVLPSVGAILAFAVAVGAIAFARLGRFARP